MIRVNLLPIEERLPEPGPSLKIPNRGFWIPLAISVAVLVPLVGMGVMQQVRIAGLKSDIALAEAEARRLQPQIEKIDALMRERSEINDRLLTVQSLARDRYLPVQVLDELADRTPEYLWFTKLHQRSTGELALEGMTFSNLLVAELMTQMEEGDIFDEVALGVSQRKAVAGRPLVEFTLTSRVRP
ncbi:MAG: hypothetical protein GF346_07650 [Candidatus Eisenbacteria bacterium]|nr:hypothetical protein [Candidatus Latescibacterota bacterium]MBD3302306.1 hypothetical protein [Candidatus Eisenbacteria bacterium]